MDTAAQGTGNTADGRRREITVELNAGPIYLRYGLKRFFIVLENDFN